MLVSVLLTGGTCLLERLIRSGVKFKLGGLRQLKLRTLNT